MTVLRILLALTLYLFLAPETFAKSWVLRLKNDSKEKMDFKVNGFTYTINGGNYRDVNVENKVLVYATSTDKGNLFQGGKQTVPQPSGTRGQVSAALQPITVGKDYEWGRGTSDKTHYITLRY